MRMVCVDPLFETGKTKDVLTLRACGFVLFIECFMTDIAGFYNVEIPEELYFCRKWGSWWG